MSDPAPDTWPDPPRDWPPIMTAVQVCQYLHLDQGRTIRVAKQMLRHICKTRGIPQIGKIGGQILFRRAAIDARLAEIEREESEPGPPSS